MPGSVPATGRGLSQCPGPPRGSRCRIRQGPAGGVHGRRRVEGSSTVIMVAARRAPDHRPAVGAALDRRSISSPPATRTPRRRERVADVEAHITGTVWKVEVAVGDRVEEGDTVLILESMKMEM